DSPGRRENDSAYTHIPHGLHERHRPANVDRVVIPRIQNRLRHRDARREVIDHVHFLKQSPEFRSVTDIAAREMDIRRERLWVTCREIVNPADLMSLAGKLVSERRAEES